MIGVIHVFLMTHFLLCLLNDYFHRINVLSFVFMSVRDLLIHFNDIKYNKITIYKLIIHKRIPSRLHYIHYAAVAQGLKINHVGYAGYSS